ncbi:MAG: hypothetical protein KKF68_01105 [Nanoarchaeota archaeon]|nr:hypothetical protein [Nanoarchaeota archaeon]
MKELIKKSLEPFFLDDSRATLRETIEDLHLFYDNKLVVSIFPQGPYAHFHEPYNLVAEAIDELRPLVKLLKEKYFETNLE